VNTGGFYIRVVVPWWLVGGKEVEDDDMTCSDWVELEMSKWVSTREPTRLTMGSRRVGLKKIQFFQK